MLSTKLITVHLRSGKFATPLNLAMEAFTINGTKKKMMCTSTLPSQPLVKAKKASTAKSVKSSTALKVKPSKPLQEDIKVKRKKSSKKTATPDLSADTLFSYLHSLSLPVLGGMAFLVFLYSPEEMPSSLQATYPHSSPLQRFDDE